MAINKANKPAKSEKVIAMPAPAPAPVTPNTSPAEPVPFRLLSASHVIAPHYQAGQTIRVPLSSLVKLTETHIPYCEDASRETTRERVVSIAASIETGEVLPPLEVTNTTIGYVIIDGNHRHEAYEMYALSSLNDSAQSVVDDVVKDDTLTDLQKKARKELRAATLDATMVEVLFVEGIDEPELIKMAFTANLKHGLPLSPAGRSKYALWLLAEGTRLGAPISIRQAARMAGVTHKAILDTVKRMKDRERFRQMYASTNYEEDREELAGIELPAPATMEASKQDRAIMRITDGFKMLDTLVKLIPNDSDRAQIIASYANQVTLEQCREMEEICGIWAERTTVLSSREQLATPEQKALKGKGKAKK